jgi:hypothetical protein
MHKSNENALGRRIVNNKLLTIYATESIQILAPFFNDNVCVFPRAARAHDMCDSAYGWAETELSCYYTTAARPPYYRFST